jgi:hypothetical protein
MDVAQPDDTGPGDAVTSDTVLGDTDAPPTDITTQPDVPVAASPWAVDRLSTGDGLRRIWGPGDGTFWAVGDRGALLYFNGATWAPAARLTTQTLYGVSGLPSGEVFVAGAKGTVLRHDSAGWNRLDAGVDDDLFAVAAVSANDVYFVGAGGRVVHFDGATFETEPSNTLSDLFAITVPPGGAPMAGGTSGRVFKRQGGQWVQLQAAGPTVAIREFFALSAQFVVAVGTEGTILLSTGGGFEAQVSNDVDLHDLSAVWGTSTSDVTAAGKGGTLIHFDGAKWTTVPADGPLYSTASIQGLYGTTVGDARLAFAVGENGAILRYDGATWRDEKSGPDVAFRAVTSLAFGELMGVGDDGLAMRWTAEHGWASVDLGPSHDWLGVCAQGQRAMVVGADGAMVAVDVGDKLHPVDSPTTRTLNAVASEEGLVLAVGQAGVAVTVSGGVAATESTGVVTSLDGVTFRPGGSALAVGDTGTILERAPGGTWSLIDSPTSVGLHAVTSRVGLDLIVGDHGTVLERTVLEGKASDFTRVFELPGLFLYGVYSDDTLTTAVGWAGRSVTRTAAGWVEDTPATANVLEGVAGPLGGPVFAVGHGGTVLRRL